MAKSMFHCMLHPIAADLRDAGAVRVMPSGDAASPSTSCALGMVSACTSHHDHRPRAQEKTMAEPQKTKQEKEPRRAAQRAAHDTQQQDYRTARARTKKKYWLVVGAIVII